MMVIPMDDFEPETPVFPPPGEDGDRDAEDAEVDNPSEAENETASNLRQGLRDARRGNTFPISGIWDDYNSTYLPPFLRYPGGE